MLHLKDDHPDVYTDVMTGEFAVQRSADCGFVRVAVDHTMEQTLSKHTKTSGGILGLGLRPGAVQRWILTAHECSAVTECYQELAEVSTISHGSLFKVYHSTRLRKDEDAVRNVMTQSETL